MKNITSKLTAVALLLALGATSVNAQPVTFDGRFYEVFSADGISWDDASAAANNRVFGGVQGHLATITSAAEGAFIETVRSAAGLSRQEVWVGGFQDLPCVSGTEPQCGWTWVNGEGVFPGVDSVTPYANWPADESEPNDNTGPGSENHLAIGLFSIDRELWNDEGALGNIGGYVVEFESGTVDPSDCNPCNPSGFMTVDTSGIDTPEGQSITQKAKEPDPFVDPVCSGPIAYRDPRVNDAGEATSIRSLDVFDELGGGDPGTLILDEFNYGSPCFAVVEGSATFAFTAGVVRNEQLPDEIPGIGPVFGCTDADLQKRVDFGYQTDDLNDMIEMSEAAMTSGCNSPSRAGTFRFSFFVLNTHEDCGIPFGTNAAAVLQCFKDLARDKFDAAHQSLKNAKKSLSGVKFGKLQSELSNAKDKFLSDDFDGSLAHLAVLLGRVTDDAMFSGTFNHQGNLIMRIENLQHRVGEIKAAQAALP